MADFASVSVPDLIVDRTHGTTQNRFRYAGDMSLGLSSPVGVGEWDSGGAVFPPPQPGDVHFTTAADRESIGYGWFGLVHILPRTPLDFGPILAAQTEEFELFNARSTPVSLNNVVDNTGTNSGVSIPDLPSLPVVVSAFSSILGPSSTRLSPVRITLEVAKEGSPRIDGTLDFLFSNSQTLSIEISGTRLQLVTGIYEAGVRERLQFLTEIHQARSGKEKRISLRRNPRQLFDVLYRLSGEERQRMDALLFGAQDQPMAFPLWHEEVNTTAAAVATATSLAVAGASEVDFRVGGFAVIYESHTKFDVLTLSGVTDSLLSFAASPLVNSYGAGARVAPVRLAILRSMPSGNRFPVAVQDYQLQFLVIDNETGALTGSTSGWSTYDGLVILDDCHGIVGQVGVEHEQRVRLIDSSTGVSSLSTRWPSSRRGSQRTFFMRSRSQILSVRRLLIALGGRQKSFWQPTRHEDLTVVANLTSGSQAMDVTNVSYFRNVRQRAGKNRIRVNFTDGTSVERAITDSEEISVTVERLTVDTVWSATRTPAEVARVEFVEPTRFDADEFVFNYERAGRATLRAPTRMLL